MPLFPDRIFQPKRSLGFQFLGQVTPWLVLALGLGGTVWAWRALKAQDRAFHQQRLGAAMAQTREAVEHRLEEQVKLLLGAQGLVVGRPGLAPEDWHAYVASLDLRRFSPGTRLMAYLPAAHLEGRPGALPLVEPEALLSRMGPEGYRLLGQPALREAGRRAQASGELAVAQGLLLPQSQAPAVAFLLPVFRDFASPTDAAGRRAAFQGLVLCVADAEELFRSLYGATPIAGLDVEIYQGPDPQKDRLLYDRDLCGGAAAMAAQAAASRMPLTVGGQRWTLVVGFLPDEQDRAREHRAWLVGVGGAAVSLLAFGLTLFLAHSRSRFEALWRQLQESEARFRSVAETASCAIFIYSDAIEYMNDTGLRMTGYSREEIVGAPLWKLVHPLDQDLVRERARQRLRGDTVPVRYEFRILTRRGETRWIDFASGTVALGDRVMGLGTAFDVTQRVEANEARLQVERKLLEAQKLESLGLLAGGVAHDFNNLLTVIQGNAGMVRESGDDPDFAAACLKNIEDTCRRAADLVRQMLAYSGRGRVHVEPLDLNRLVQDIGQLLGVSIPKAVALRFELAERLPPIAADAAQVQQVVLNLVTNAAEAIGGREGAVVLRTGLKDLDAADLGRLRVAEAAAPGSFAWLEVEDTGAGMDPSTLARIFDPFFTTKFTGRGLGLAAMQGIVRGHGGAVDIASAPDQGTVFRVYFPAAPGLALPPEPSEEPAAPAGEGLVLLADDEPGIRDYARRVLERQGFEVLAAEDGRQALALAEARLGDLRLALLDLTMPRMGGLEAEQGLRSLGFQGPVVTWSGYAVDGPEEGPGLFLRKPFDAAELLAAVARALG